MPPSGVGITVSASSPSFVEGPAPTRKAGVVALRDQRVVPRRGRPPIDNDLADAENGSARHDVDDVRSFVGLDGGDDDDATRGGDDDDDANAASCGTRNAIPADRIAK